jgi:ElaB/YqjD/DUF883 family membrane-anchored ribosome-binding protein
MQRASEKEVLIYLQELADYVEQVMTMKLKDAKKAL